MRVTAKTRLFALLGDPVAQSLSPTLQNAAFHADRRDAVYLALRCATDDVPTLMRAIVHAGGGGNITVPHKRAAVAALDAATDAVARTGVCNTFWGVDGAVHGDNTDVVGFAAALHDFIGSVTGSRVLLLGAGGAASAVLCALLDAGVAGVEVRARRRDRAAQLCESMRDARCRPGENDARGTAGFDLVVNATSLGMHDGDALPAKVAAGMPAVFDVVYRRGGTAWVRAARACGVPACDGLTMLLHQGAAAFEHWFGAPPPLQAMRAALAEP